MTDWIDTEINLTDGTCKATTIINKSIVASIFPSTYDGFFYITHVDGQTGIYEYLSKPVRREYLSGAFEAMGIDVTAGQWNLEKCAPLEKPPYSEPHKKSANDSLVYFIRGAGMIKIGVADSPESRMSTLQAGSPVPLYLLATMQGGFSKEKELHAKFAASRRHGEWFECTPELERTIRECQAQSS